MTRGRVIGQLVVIVLMLGTSGIFYWLLLEEMWMGALGMTLMWLLIMTIWRFVHPIVPTREGWIWKLGQPVEMVDGMLEPVYRMRRWLKVVLLFVLGLAGLLWTGAYVAMINGLPAISLVSLVGAFVTWLAFFFFGGLLENADQ